MQLALIVAMSRNFVIGNHNQLPWHMPADLQHFKKNTLGKPIIMGRKTYESIGKPLLGRDNIIITRQIALQAPGCQIVHSLEQALVLTQAANEVMVIGGAELFKLALPSASILYLTLIHHEFTGDILFPDWQKEEWQETAHEDHAADEKNPYPYSFLTLERRHATLKR